VDKYLLHHAESECNSLDGFPKLDLDACLIVPCYNEGLEFINQLEAATFPETTPLIIVVVNQPLTATLGKQVSSTTSKNQKILDHFCQSGKQIWAQSNLTLYQLAEKRKFWLVTDKTSIDQRIPAKQGVGLARKIGADLALQLIHQGRIRSKWLHCTDADTILPENYFDIGISGASPLHSVAISGFTHIPCPIDNDVNVWKATQLYERALNYYIAGLSWAGSPYAVATIGSILSIDSQSYAQVRGFPKLSAGEDFYLINKLIKQGPVLHREKCVVKIISRTSDRIPFGTGPAIDKILQLNSPYTDYCYYAPEIFSALKQWLDLIPKIDNLLNLGLEPLGQLPQNTKWVLEQANISKLWQHLEKQANKPEDYIKMTHDWFDAFQTLKFIRRMQEFFHPQRPLLTCIEEAPFDTP